MIPLGLLIDQYARRHGRNIHRPSKDCSHGIARLSRYTSNPLRDAEGTRQNPRFIIIIILVDINKTFLNPMVGTNGTPRPHNHIATRIDTSFRSLYHTLSTCRACQHIKQDILSIRWIRHKLRNGSNRHTSQETTSDTYALYQRDIPSQRTQGRKRMLEGSSTSRNIRGNRLLCNHPTTPNSYTRYQQNWRWRT